MKLNLVVRSTPVDEIAGPAGHRKLTIGARRGIQRALELVQKHHKNEEYIRRGKNLKGRDAHPTKLTQRSGTLSKSYRTKIVERELAGYYGSDVVYSRIHEFGFNGVQSVKPHTRKITKAFGRQLAFPVFVNVGAHDRDMKIPKRPGLQNTVNATKAKIEQIMADEIAQELTRGQ